ncbi:hypothetical protein BJ912DRAFT_1100186 [Pholiota molesta]|nr:hypothetical protein BJ912DRAFT_1100186 [Pholiota molesta]
MPFHEAFLRRFSTTRITQKRGKLQKQKRLNPPLEENPHSETRFWLRRFSLLCPLLLCNLSLMRHPRSSATANTTEKASKPVTKKRGKKVDAEESKPAKPLPEDDGEGEEKCKIDWNGSLSLKLVNAILANPNIKQGLYPSPGGNMASLNSGGNKKTRQSVWGAKIKNRLVRMTKITHEHNETLGKTGQGIERAEDVDMSLNNSFTNKWAEIIAECPWYLEMRSLIAERPNIVTVGVGNSSSSIDVGVLQNLADPSVDDDDDVVTSEAPTSEGPGHNILNDDVADAIMATSDLDIESEALEEKKSNVKRKAALVLSDSEDIKPTVKTLAQPGKSKLASSTAGPKKRTRLEELSVAAQAEELTRQKELEVNKAKIEASARVRIENSQAQRDIIKAKLALKCQAREEKAKKRKAKMQQEIELKKMQFEHELNMAKLRVSAGLPSTSAMQPPSDDWTQNAGGPFELNYEFTQEDFANL